MAKQHLSRDQVIFYKKEFDKLDLDKNGTISANEIRTVVDKLGFKNISDRKITDLVDKLDTDSSGDISFYEFLTGIPILMEGLGSAPGAPSAKPKATFSLGRLILCEPEMQDEDVPGPVKMVSMRDIPACWLRKMVVAIKALSKDKDSLAARMDAMSIANNIIDTGKADEQDEKTDIHAVHEKFATIFCSETSITKTICQLWHLVNTDKDFKANLTKSLNQIYHIADTNDNGFIELNEFQNLWKLYDLNPFYCELQFSYIDKDANGVISDEEFVQAGIEYFFNLKNELTNNMFWGPY